MKEKHSTVLLLLTCFVASCAVCMWAWLFAIDLLFFGITVAPAFFLQMLIRRGGKEWTWLLATHAVILLCTFGIGGLIWILGENWEPLHGMLLVIVGGAALVGCLFELVIHLMSNGKDERDETHN